MSQAGLPHDDDRTDLLLAQIPPGGLAGLAHLAASGCAAPTAIIALVGAGGLRIQGEHGVLAAGPSPSLALALCRRVMERAQTTVVPEVSCDARLADASSAAGEAVRFCAGVRVVSSDGRPLGAVCVFDREPRTLTTAHEECLRAVARQTGAIIELLQAASAKTERRHRALASVATLTGGIAHDLNNMLAPILITAAVLRETEDDPERRHDLQAIETCAERGADMVRQLLSVARGADRSAPGCTSIPPKAPT